MIYTHIPVSMFKENNMTALLSSSSSHLCIPSLLSINHCSKLRVYLYGFSLSISIIEKYFVLKIYYLFKLDLEKAEHQRSNCQHLLDHLGEGNGTPLQYFCLENPMDREAW